MGCEGMTRGNKCVIRHLGTSVLCCSCGGSLLGLRCLLSAEVQNGGPFAKVGSAKHGPADLGDGIFPYLNPSVR